MSSLRLAIRKARHASKRRRFVRTGMKPWTKGYLEYRTAEIVRVLAGKTFQANALPESYAFRLDERIVEYPWLFSRLPAAPGSLLDAGSALNFDYLLKQPVLQNKRLHICTLAPEADCFWEKGVSYVFDDLRRLPYRDELFDSIACISTIEHVGMDNTLLYTNDGSRRESSPCDYCTAIAELRRVLKPGGSIFLTVPYGKAVDHGWFQMFNEQMVNNLVEAFNPVFHSRDYFAYHPDGWRSSNAQDTANATGFDIHHAKGYDPDYAAAARAVCCLELKR